VIGVLPEHDQNDGKKGKLKKGEKKGQERSEEEKKRHLKNSISIANQPVYVWAGFPSFFPFSLLSF